jgi:predicted O-methyltransferase YrrM
MNKELDFEIKTLNLDIKENLAPDDSIALIRLIAHLRENKNRPLRIVEIGSWKGWSTMLLADIDNEVYAVDHWQGTEGTWNEDVAKQVDIFSVFRHNMTMLGLQDRVHPMMMTSMDAARIFKDDSVDMVFIDANHYFKNVCEDITNWKPKVKNSGILCGHDAEGFYNDFPIYKKVVIDENPETDVIKGIGHPGVIKALHVCLGDQYGIVPGKHSRVWYQKQGYPGWRV